MKSWAKYPREALSIFFVVIVNVYTSIDDSTYLVYIKKKKLYGKRLKAFHQHSEDIK